MSAWARALAPMLAGPGADAGPGVRYDLVSVDGGLRLRAAQKALSNRPDEDGGSQTKCDPGPVRIALRHESVDLVVAIDTSGSMFANGSLVNRWLVEKLEPALQKSGFDYQLQVVVDLEQLGRLGHGKGVWAPSDAGIHVHEYVRSTDVLRVLLRSAKQSGSSWLTRLRPDSSVHLVIVTDDDPDRGSAAPFIQQLTRLARGRLGTEAAPTFQFHAVLGMELSAPWALLADAGLEERVCAEAAGRDYQLISTKTGGLRGSVCRAESYEAFTELLIGSLGRAGQTCDLPLPANFPAERLTSIRAIGKRELPLHPAFDAFNCEQSRDRYVLQKGQLTVCPATCRALTDDGYTAIEAVATCP